MKCYPAETAAQMEALLEKVASLDIFHKAPEVREEAIQLLRSIKGSPAPQADL